MPADFARGLKDFDFAAYERDAHRHGLLELSKDKAVVGRLESLARAAMPLAGDYPGRTAAMLAAAGTDEESGPDSAGGARADDDLSRSAAIVAAHFCISHYRNLTDAMRLYDHYAAIPLLRHLLRIDARMPLAGKRDRIWSVFQDVLAAQIAFERDALAGRLAYPTRDFSPEVARQRLLRLADLRRAVPAAHRTGPASSRQPRVQPPAHDLSAVIEACGQPGVVRRLLVFPQTTCHDEVAFIRLIQLAECLFWGSLLHVAAAMGDINAGRVADAASAVRQASQFAGPLVSVFHAVRTMPPAHFLAFRHTTDHASAIQSLSWQLLDAHVYGVLPEKAGILLAMPSVSPEIERLAHPDFRSLARSVAALPPESADAIELRAAVVELDHGLRAWRKFHEKQLAGRSSPGYLPEGARGTGGTSGYSYLAVQRPPRIYAR